MSDTEGAPNRMGHLFAQIVGASAVGTILMAAAPLSAQTFPLGSGEHVGSASRDVRVDAAPELYQGATAAATEAPLAGTGASGALVITPTFDSSITSDPNSAAIQVMINNAIAIYEARFNDPITVSILFRYLTTAPDGSALPSGVLATSTYVLYAIPWNTYITDLNADVTTTNDTTANASLPGGALSTNILPSSADGRAVGLNTPPAMFADGSVGVGGPYDGIVTLNSSQPFTFTRPPAAGMYDALRTTEHEMDEVLGLGSGINTFSDLRPQDLFSWSAPGTRNLASSGSRYVSINGGTTNIVDFNQNPNGDFGDWLSGSCPQGNPYVQNAFSCANQASDVTQTSPEGINLDVIGYDLIIGPTPTPALTPTATGTSLATPAPTLTESPPSPLTPTPTPTPGCGDMPEAGCRTPAVPGKATLALKDNPDDAKDALAWRWSKGAVTAKAEFGDPTTATAYDLCIYDATPALILSASIPPGGLCGTLSVKPCWKATRHGFVYANKLLTPDGVQQLTLTEGLLDGKAKITAKGKGVNLDMPPLPLTPPLRVQLKSTAGVCWEATYNAPTKNDAGQFKARSD